ncbi:MAG TPA: RDD family protein [Acidimicrobiia bacterium]|nr:RDD family protein [Acidimicrobiia bacterium]
MQCPACGALSGSWRRPCGRCGERPSLRAYGRLAFAEDPTTPNRVRHPRPAEIAPPRARITAAALDVTFAALALFWSGTIGPDPAFASGQSSARLLSRALVVLAVLAAPAVMEAAGGQTFGKRIVGIRVVDRGTGRPIGFWTAVHRGGARALFWFVSFLALADPLLQPLHDRSAGTVVINDDDAGWVPPPDSVIRSP